MALIYPNNAKKYAGTITQRSANSWRYAITINAIRYGAAFPTFELCEAARRAKSNELGLTKNIAHDMGDHLAVELTQGKLTLIDKEDIDKMDAIIWSCDDNGYAANRNHVKLHNLIMNFVKHDNLTIDHMNCNPSDNRKANLRIATKQVQAINQRMRKNNKSGIKGVSYNETENKWIASWCEITQKKKRFDTIEEATAYRQMKERELAHYREALGFE